MIKIYIDNEDELHMIRNTIIDSRFCPFAWKCCLPDDRATYSCIECLDKNIEYIVKGSDNHQV